MKKNDIKKELEEVEKICKTLKAHKEILTQKELTQEKINELKKIARGKASIVKEIRTTIEVIDENEQKRKTTITTRYKDLAKLTLDANNISY